MKTLTIKQRRVLEEIKNFLRSGHSPTLAELGARVDGMAASGVFLILKALEERGFLEPRKGKSRSIRLSKMAMPVNKWDGLPIRAWKKSGVCQWREDESLWKSSKINGDLFKKTPDFFIEAVGGAVYKKKGMRREDLLAVKECDDYSPSDVVAVRIGKKQVWVGTGKKKKKAARFIQTDLEILEIGPEDKVLGIVVGVVRLTVTRNQ